MLSCLELDFNYAMPSCKWQVGFSDRAVQIFRIITLRNELYQSIPHQCLASSHYQKRVLILLFVNERFPVTLEFNSSN